MAETPPEALQSAPGRRLHPRDLALGRLFTLVADAVIIGDASTGSVLLWSPAAARIFGYTEEEAIGMPIVELVPEALRQAHLSGLARYRRAGTGAVIDQGSTAEVEARSKDGGRLWVELSLTSLDDTARPRLVMAQLRDVTARHQPHEVMRASLGQEPSPAADAVVVADVTTGLVVLWSAAAERLFGYTEVEAVGMPIVELVPEQWKQAHLDGLARYRKTGTGPVIDRGSTVELQARSKDGGQLWVELSLTALHDLPRQHLVLALVRDVTARHHAHEELRRSNEELDRVAMLISHDLAEPLHVIRGLADLLLDDLGDEPRAEHRLALERIRAATDRGQLLIDDLLMFARISSSPPAEAPVDLATVIRGCLADLSATITEVGATVEVEALPTVRANPTLMRQLFQNLIGNAVKFTDPTRTPLVTVSARRVDSEWRIEVTDNGVGIEPGHRERIFGMFTRLHPATAYPGTGIGLAVCKKIVEQHGGRIGVDDNPVGGSVFWFTLPVK